MIPYGSPIPLTLSLHDGRTDRFPLAQIYNLTTGSPLPGGPFPLTHLSGGYYQELEVIPPEVDALYEVRYAVYADSDHSQVLIEYGFPVERIQVSNGDFVNLTRFNQTMGTLRDLKRL